MDEMNELLRLVFDLVIVRRAIIFNFGWAIHVSPIDHLESIRKEGLRAYRDATPSDDIREFVPEHHVLCLHPLGAHVSPPPVCQTIEYRPEIEMVTFAVHREHIPQRVHLDWSNAWEKQTTTIWELAQMPVEEIVRRVLVKYGSFVSYDTIPQDKLRVFCKGSQPTNPLSWPALSACAEPLTYFKA